MYYCVFHFSFHVYCVFYLDLEYMQCFKYQFNILNCYTGQKSRHVYIGETKNKTVYRAALYSMHLHHAFAIKNKKKPAGTLLFVMVSIPSICVENRTHVENNFRHIITDTAMYVRVWVREEMKRLPQLIRLWVGDTNCLLP